MSNLLDDPVYRLQQALRGFHRAKVRCDRLGAKEELDEIFLDLTEALWWTRSVDEGMETLIGQLAYRSARLEDWEGRHVNGLRLARNLSGHHRALAVTRTGGLRVPFTVPLTIPPIHVVWRSRHELPEARTDVSGEQSYDKYLAGKPVVGTLDAAAGWFARAQNAWPDKLGVRRWPWMSAP